MKREEFKKLFNELLKEEIIDVDTLTYFFLKTYKTFKITNSELRSLESWCGYRYIINLSNATFEVDGYSQYWDSAFISYMNDFETLKNKCEKFLDKAIKRYINF